MRNLFRGVAAIAIVSGALAGCASPQYPTREGYAAGPPWTAPKPKYPTSDAAPPAAGASGPSPAADAAQDPPSPQLAAPVAPVESQPLPPPAPAPSSASSAAAPSSALAQNDPPAADPDATPPIIQPETPAPAPTPSPPPPAPTPDTPPPVAAETPLAPRAVIHDETTPPPPVSQSGPARETMATVETTRRYGERATTIAGPVVAASGVFENYEVQKGDHVDALARAFKTSRTVLLDANDLKAPYRLRPGQILKVPVADAYVAERGDTLSGVARRFGVEAAELADLNHISMHAPLRAGEAIGLPSSMHDRGPLRSAGASEEYAQTARTPRSTDDADGERADMATPLGGSRPGITQLTPTGPAPTPWRPAAGAGYHTIAPGAASQAIPTMTDEQVSAAAHGRFAWPVHGDIVTRFGPIGVGQRSDGVDIKAPQGSMVTAAAPGEVVYAGDQVPGFGNLVLIKHADGWVTAYAHLDTVMVKMKQQVAQGDQLGSVGMSGGLAEPELHFEVRYAPTPTDKARPVDPMLVLPSG